MGGTGSSIHAKFTKTLLDKDHKGGRTAPKSRKTSNVTMKYRLLGRSGLRVSEFALGTMTFGDDWGWGAPKDEAQKVYNAFRESAAISLTLLTFTPTARAS